MEEVKALKEEVDRLKEEVRWMNSQREAASLSSNEGGVKRDLSLQSLIMPWSGDISDRPIDQFLQNFSLVAERGGWSEADKIMICRLKLKGAAADCVACRPELLLPTATFVDMVDVIRTRFVGEATPEQKLLELNSLEQLSGEDARQFADRCRQVGEKTLPISASVVEAGWARAQLERILMAAYIKGLKGEPSRQLQYDPPKTFHEAVARASRIEQVRVKSTSPREIWAVQGSSGLEGKTTVEPQRSGSMCFRCGRPGHFAKSCDLRRRKSLGWGNQRSEAAPSKRETACFVCGQRGHYARDCARRATLAKVRTCYEGTGPHPKAEGSTDGPTSNAR
uniref:CCHC-type domain-containing protein n=1 Tax=Rhodnius prolixus TaxID=13249 RepID=T1I2C9_RHOPR